MRTRELRLALVCFGGVSLAVYMHGVTKEVWKLARASMRRKAPAGTVLVPACDSEIVYGELLDSLPGLDLRVMVDIVAGASAGGINGILLAQAISQGQDMEPLRDLWLHGADSDELLDPRAASRRFSKLWAIPLVWWARRKGLAGDDRAEMAAHQEVATKLSRFMRSRWFAPPFSGERFAGLIYDALQAMAAAPRTPPLVPAQHPIDLDVTVTDWHGAPETLRLHSPPLVVENEHRLIIGFKDQGGPRRHLADPAELAFAARATASFPGAFPAARIGEIDAVLAARGAAWPGRNAFLARLFPGRDPETASLIDGAVLNSRPFGPALAALAQRPAHREVDRRFVYVDPKPGTRGALPGEPAAAPGFFSAILRSLADIPRQQPIRDSLANIDRLAARVRRLRHILDGMTPEVETAIGAAIGWRVLLFRPTAARIAEWRSRLQATAAREAGYAYGAYGRLKLAQIIESIAGLLAAIGGHDPVDVRDALWGLVAQRGYDHTSAAQGRDGASSDYVMFLRRFDLEFRIRRLRFMVRRVNALAEAAAVDAERAPLEDAKARLYAILAPHEARRQPGFYPTAAARAAAQAVAAPAAALAALEDAMDLRGLDETSDAALETLFGVDLPGATRRTLLAAYLGFPFYDVALLPLTTELGIDEFEEIKVDRLSPDDALSLRGAGGGLLKGALFNAFGAFFSRAYREHDYLWGRLHGAERMIDIVVSALPADSRLPAHAVAAIKRRAFRAIIAAERDCLAEVPELFAALDALLGQAEAETPVARAAAG